MNKAWEVNYYSDDGPRGEIVFNQHGVAARRIGAGKLGVEFEEVECRRVSEYDQFAEQGWVPARHLIDTGWQFFCRECELRIGSDAYDYDEEKPIDLDGMVTFDNSHVVYCSQQCQRDFESRIDTQNKKFNDFKDKITELRPDLRFTKFRGAWPSITMVGEFMFDGGKYGGSVRDQNGDGELTWFIANGDKEAWDAYEAARNNT